MGAVSVLVFLLVCAFTAAADALTITCDDVTGLVGKELNLTCRVSDQSNTCCIDKYKFVNKDKDTVICREEISSDSCKNFTSFSCPYTPNEVMTTTFNFFLQTPCGPKSTDFTVNIAEALIHEQQEGKKDFHQDNTVLVVTILGICLVIVIVVGLILKRKYICTKILQTGYILGEREENNIPEPQNKEDV